MILKLTVKSIGEEDALLEIGDKQIKWPKDKLPQIKSGEKLMFLILNEDDKNEENDAFAKNILNELLSQGE
jgi:hypothetical protein